MRQWTLQRVFGAALVLLPAVVMADATHGGLEASSLTLVRTNSFGAAEDLRLGMRVPLGRVPLGTEGLSSSSRFRSDHASGCARGFEFGHPG